MTAVHPSTATAYNVVAATGSSFEEGFLVIDSSNTLAIYTTQAQVSIGVVDQTPTDADAAARTTRAGEAVGIFFIGSGLIVNVASANGDTYALGAVVYGGQTSDTDGYCSSDSSNSAVAIGHCARGVTTTAAGQLIEVLLDEPGV